MIKFDFNTYMDVEVNLDKYEELAKKLSDVPFIKNVITESDIKSIKEVSNYIKNNCEVLLVIGIGGSFMGSYALKSMFTNEFTQTNPEVIYIGNDLSGKYLNEVIDYIKEKEVMVNVISKSGNTLEVKLIYELIKNRLLKKYTKDELISRIIITTDKTSGDLRKEVNKYGYKSLEIPREIGGRYSLMTPAHLLILDVLNIDINKLLNGFIEGFNLKKEAYYYAYIRNKLFNQKKYIENFSIYEKELYYYTEWLKQLFGESEGKEGKGIFPVSTVNTRDLHSLGQFIEDGNSIIFETVIKVLNNNDIIVNDKSLNKINNIILDSVSKTHYKSNTPSNIITIDEINEYNIGKLSSFFMMSAVLSAYLFEVNPFNQDGVELYKKEVSNNL